MGSFNDWQLRIGWQMDNLTSFIIESLNKIGKNRREIHFQPPFHWKTNENSKFSSKKIPFHVLKIKYQVAIPTNQRHSNICQSFFYMKIYSLYSRRKLLSSHRRLLDINPSKTLFIVKNFVRIGRHQIKSHRKCLHMIVL